MTHAEEKVMRREVEGGAISSGKSNQRAADVDVFNLVTVSANSFCRNLSIGPIKFSGMVGSNPDEEEGFCLQ